LVKRQRGRGVPRGPSLFIAYLFWLTGGLMGLHRFYLRSWWGFLFVPVFLASLYVSDGIRDRREDVSRTHAAYEAAASLVRRSTWPPGVTMTQNETTRLEKAKADQAKAKV